MNLFEQQPRFTKLFSGLDIAFGTGKGEWIKRPPEPKDFLRHLKGEGPGMGIAPLREDNTVLFAAIDLDDSSDEAFADVKEMQDYIPGPSFIEVSRSGNAHLWVFFEEPIEAWVAMGVLKEATKAVGRDHVEVFPKNHDFARVKLGNYINLPYFGADDGGNRRKVIIYDGEKHALSLGGFLSTVEENKNDPAKWRNTANWLQLSSPAERTEYTEFGTQQTLHICAEHVLSGAAGPVTEGHRSVVYFSLAKQLFNCVMYDRDEVIELLRNLNEDSAPDTIPDTELLRIIGNAERGRFTSTGCDDPLFAPYAHPQCKIANG